VSRPHRLSRSGAAVLTGLLLTAGAVGCSSTDDGATVRNVDGTDVASASGSGSGTSGSGSGVTDGTASGSGSGLAEEDLSGGTENPLILAAIEQYRAYVIEQVDQTVATTQQMADAIDAGDLETAKSLYAPSRQGWEAIEPIAGLIEEIDGKVDARVDDFENEDDPEFTGWHRIEYLLWEKGDTAAAAPYAEQLVADLKVLQTEVETIEIPPAALTVGAAELIEEVSTGKITGEEDRYSGTDLWDFAANVAGSEKLIELLTPALEEADPELLADIQAGFADINAALAAYEDGEGYKPYSTLTEADKTAMQTILAGLSENLAQVSGALGLE
jgi:iron uptake system component EfeO